MSTTPLVRIAELEPYAVRAAHSSIHPAFIDSPQYLHEGLSARLGMPVIVKVETTNPIRSFKGRGTWVAIAALAKEGRIGPDRPVVCVSAGNFGQGVAFAARALGIPAVVFCSTRANPGKVARMRTLGADVQERGDDFDDARGESEAYVAAHDAELLVDGEDPRISTGAGTLALELTDAVESGVLPTLASIIVPVGNGALLNGVGAWLRAVSPATRIVGVQAAAADAMTRSWQAGRPIDTDSAATYADGIASRVAIPRAVELMAGRVDDMLTVSEDDLRAAQATLTDELGITVEGAAAASWAGALIERDRGMTSGPVVVIVTGSNV
jgi:threonine dehydratase